MPSKDKIISNFILIYDLKQDLNLDKAQNPSPENIKRKGTTTFRLPELWLPHIVICKKRTEIFTYFLTPQKHITQNNYSSLMQDTVNVIYVRNATKKKNLLS